MEVLATLLLVYLLIGQILCVIFLANRTVRNIFKHEKIPAITVGITCLKLMYGWGYYVTKVRRLKE